MALKGTIFKKLGQNWGQAEFQSNTLSFNVASKLAFDIPLADVSNAAVVKNEVCIEFAAPAPLNPDEPTARKREDVLVEMRFYVPGTVTANQVDESDGKVHFRDKNKDPVQEALEGQEEGEVSTDAQEVLYNEEGEALTAASLFCETIKQKADYGANLSEAIVHFTELLCLTPRGRFNVEMHDLFLRLRGKSHDYKIMYTNIKRLFLLPRPDDLHFHFIIGLDPPLRQGQTRYPYLVFQFEREDEIELDVNLTEQVIAEKYAGKLHPKYDGPVYHVVSDIFQALSGKKAMGPSTTFRSALGQSSVKAAIKANEAILYPLEKSFLSIPKPPMYFSFNEINVVEFSRAGALGSTKTFEVKFGLTSGIDHTFSSIPREEYVALEAYCRSKRLNVIAEEEPAPSYRESRDDDRSKRARTQGTLMDLAGEDLDSESGNLRVILEDEDFDGAKESEESSDESSDEEEEGGDKAEPADED